MSGYPASFYDAFTEVAFGGSQAAVILDANTLDVQQRVKIAREIGLPATAFVDDIGDDWVTARRGEGAWFRARNRDGVRLSAEGGTTQLGEAHGFAPTFQFEGDRRRGIIDTFHHVRRLHNVGCSAHEYRTLAQGRVDFIVTARLNPWDHAAGALIVEEAGGVARLVDGRAYAPTVTEGHLLTARNETLWAEAAERLSFLT